ncbi:MAG TPA: hypothetical protein VFI21_05840 [Nocardioides sp.]|nr:hypothetical protein [Nocardioides sp.]
MTLLFVFGPPAVGKMAVGRAIADASDFRLFHNHATIFRSSTPAPGSPSTSDVDLAAIHEWLPPGGLDPMRSALWGGSYGGYMVLAGVAL